MQGLVLVSIDLARVVSANLPVNVGPAGQIFAFAAAEQRSTASISIAVTAQTHHEIWSKLSSILVTNQPWYERNRSGRGCLVETQCALNEPGPPRIAAVFLSLNERHLDGGLVVGRWWRKNPSSRLKNLFRFVRDTIRMPAIQFEGTLVRWYLPRGSKVTNSAGLAFGSHKRRDFEIQSSGC